MTQLDSLPEVGQRAPWHTEEDWRDFLASERNALDLGFLDLEVSGVEGRLELAFFHKGQPRGQA